MKNFFAKYHALGNDYIVLDPERTALRPEPEAVRLLCDRRRGVGGDGVLWGPFPGEGGAPRVRIYNPDGGEAQKSGNGARIFAKYLKDSGRIPASRFAVDTAGGLVEVELLPGGAIKACMGKPSFESGKIPVAGPAREVIRETLIIGGKAYCVTCLTIGNPHCVVFCDAVSPELASSAGPRLECHPLFPERINVQFAKVENPALLRLEIWERGAGYTLSSGTSSCAALCAARKLGLCGRRAEISMPGGSVESELDADGRVWLSGPVKGVASGELSPELA